jgi:hypothetical protein
MAVESPEFSQPLLDLRTNQRLRTLTQDYHAAQELKLRGDKMVRRLLSI